MHDFAEGHNTGLLNCFCSIMNIVPGQIHEVVKDIITMPLSIGGMGLRSAHRTSPPAYWASWADSLVMADFGQTDFGQTDFGQPFWRPSLAKPTLPSVSVLVVWPTAWSWPTLAKPTLVKPTLASLFGDQVWPNRLCPALVF